MVDDKTTPKSESFAKRADELQAQAREFRKKAREAKRKEQAEAKRQEKEKLQREAITLLTFAKTVPLEVGGRSISVYDFLVARHSEVEAAKKAQRKADSAANEA